MKKVTKLLMLFVLCLVGIEGNAQNVTVKKSTGAAIASVPEGNTEYDTFFKEGGFATWRHEQLNLTLTTSDYPTLTTNKQLANPANNICESSTLDALCLGKGNATSDFQDIQTYLSIALPKGYSFTGYEIVWARDLQDFGTGTGSYTGGYAVFGETDENFDYKTGYSARGAYSANAAGITLKRENIEGNVLYFKLSSSGNNNQRVAITLRSVTLYFTAEADYSPLIPASVIAEPVSAVDVPFETGKVDYGTLTSRHYNGVDRVSYSSANVIDLPANFTLYEAESVEDGTNFDGTTGNVVKYQEGTISSEGQYFKAGRAAAEGQEATEQIYFIETPTYVTLPDAYDTKNPVGFRIVGAKIDYTFGEAHGPKDQEVQVPHTTSYPTFYISADVQTYTRQWQGGLVFGNWVYTIEGTKTYYMRSDASFTDNEAQKTLWFIDEDGFIRLASDPTKYLSNPNNNRMGIVTSRAAKFKVDENNGQITLSANSNMFLCLNIDVWENQYPHGTPNYFQMIQNGTYKATRTLSGSQKTVTTYTTETVEVPAFTPGEFTINLYDKTGTTVVDTKKVTSDTPDGSLFVGNLNNDAVKIGIKGVGLFKGTLTLQALDPYIDQMTVVCSDESQPAIRLTRPFFASDFSVSGGEFHFHLPSDCLNDNVKISYEELWTKYADETYTRPESDDHEPGNSRFSFVNSAHYKQFTSDNVYNNRAEAAAGKDDVHERQIVETVGTKKFRFNNTKEAGENGGSVTEYPFTQANYAAAPNNGGFETMTFKVTSSDQQKTSYVFTTDETRYNIAPTTAVQHRAYAFYEMIVHVQTTDYDPKVEIVKVYDKTDYHKSDNEIDATDAFYGAIVTAPYQEDGQTKKGYASDRQVQQAIARVIDNKEDDFNHTDIPSDAKHLLYVDMSGMEGFLTMDPVVTNGVASHKAINVYRNEDFAPNALFFMPKGTAVNDINFAYMTEGGNFRSSSNIVLTDKQPFFTPYDIQVPGETNYATYTRLITRPENGKVTSATLIMPFELDVTDGVHTNPDGKCEFSLNTMKATGTFTKTPDSDPEAIFETISGEKSEANKPYVVKVIKCEEDGDDLSFVVTQKGASIVATPKETSGLGMTKLSGETATGTYTNKSGVSTTYTCTNQGSFAGLTYDREKSQNVFYFGANRFVNLRTLRADMRYLYNYPFRSAYTYPDGGTGSNLLRYFDLNFDGDNGDTDAIVEMNKKVDLAVKTGQGSISMSSAIDQTVSIRSFNGVTVGELNMRAGDTKSIQLPAGIYVVNNVKIIVK